MDIWVGFQFLWFLMPLKWTSLLNKFLEVGLLGYRISMFKIFNMYCQMVFPKGYALTPSYQHVWECLSPRLFQCPIIKLWNISQSDLVKITYHFVFSSVVSEMEHLFFFVVICISLMNCCFVWFVYFSTTLFILFLVFCKSSLIYKETSSLSEWARDLNPRVLGPLGG